MFYGRKLGMNEVALLTEGVDRKLYRDRQQEPAIRVALLAEGVDRNILSTNQ